MRVLTIADISDRKYLAPKHPPVAKHQLLLKKAMVERGAKYTLCGNVHADDAYLGGELAGGKAGRGSKSKVPFFAGCPHRAIVADGHKPKDLPEFSWINTVLGNIKTSLDGAYHTFDFAKYGTCYLGALVYRF